MRNLIDSLSANCMHIWLSVTALCIAFLTGGVNPKYVPFKKEVARGNIHRAECCYKLEAHRGDCDSIFWIVVQN